MDAAGVLHVVVGWFPVLEAYHEQAAGKADGKTKASPKRNGVAGRYLGTVTKGIKIGFAWPCPEGHRPTGQAQTELFYPRV